MTVRFSIRTPRGQELSFASHEMFAEFVRSGELSPDDLVYDGDTGEWAPARTHPVVLEIEYEKEEKEEEPAAAGEAESGDSGPLTSADLGLDLAESRPPEDDEGADTGSPAAEDPTRVVAPDPGPSDSAGGEAFGLELAPMSAGPTAEEEAQAFVAKMEAERAADVAFSADAEAIEGFKMDDSRVFGDVIEAAPEPPPVRRDPPKRSTPAPEPPRRPEEKSGAGRKVALFILFAGVAGAGGYFGMGLLEEPQSDGSVGPIDTVAVEPPPPEPPPPEPVIASTEEAVRERAQERFLTATQALVRDLQPIPDVWLRGAYFALPSDYPEIRDVWESYVTTIREVRVGDQDRYRAAYELALDDAALQGEARTIRLDAATADFAADAEERDAHWNRVEALAVAAIRGHDALVGAEGLILYDATGASGRPGGIGAGTSGRDTDAQLLLDQVVDVMGGVLSADGVGPDEGRNVREWVWGGFLDAVTN